MKEKKELTEQEKIERTKKNFKVVGGCCIAVGIFFIAAAFINFFSGLKAFAGNVPTLIYTIISGVSAVVIGIILELRAKK